MIESRLDSQYRTLDDQQKAFITETHQAMKAGYNDPEFFSNYFLGVPLHPGQAEYLSKSDPIVYPNSSRKNILVPCNRWGKTVALAIKHIRFNFYKLLADREMSLQALKDLRYGTLDLSPHSNQVVACANYIFDILHSRFVTIIDGKKTVNKCKIESFFVSKNDSKNSIQFSNSSSFFGASTGEDQAASLAGRQFGLITYDECVFSHHLRTELPGRIMSRTVDYNAPIDLVSTFDAEAKSQQYFFRLAKGALKGKNDWYCKKGVYTDNTFLSLEIKEKSKIKIRNESYSKYRQVFLGEAVPSAIKVFDPEMIDQIFDNSLRPQPAVYGIDYLISVDWGGSDQGDPTVFMIFDYSSKPYKIVHHEIMVGGSPSLKFAALKNLQILYNDAKIIMDTNSLGGVIIKKLLNEMGVSTYDFSAHGGDKGDAVAQLGMILSKNRKQRDDGDRIVDDNPDFGELRSYYIPELEEQLGAYEIKDEKLEQDMVVVAYQAMWFLEKKYRSSDTTKYKITKDHGRSKINGPNRRR